ncbi:MAG: hypothetical protein JHC30_06000, partial [Caldisericum sp.]|nr:hypothetical protein [Caldisericum sp.]
SFTITSGDGSLFPSGNFVVTIDNERILVGSRNGDTFSSLTRGYDGTTASSHSSGTRVELRIIARHIQELQNFCNTAGQPNGLATLDTNGLVIQNPTNATSTPAASKIPIADSYGLLDKWILSGSVYNVKDYGAKGDGTTDDRTAIQSTINACSSAGGGIVFFPKGRYLLSSFYDSTNHFMLQPKSNILFMGVGAGSVITVANGLNNSGDFYIFADTSNTINNIGFYNLTFDMNGTNNLVPQSNPYKMNAAIYIYYGSNIWVEKCSFLNNAGQQSVVLGANVNTNPISNAIINNCSFNTFAGGVAGNTYQVDHSAIYAVGKDIHITNNYFYNPSPSPNATAIEIHTNNCVVSKNIIDSVHTGVIISANVNNIDGTIISDNVMTGIYTGVALDSATGYTIGQVLVSNNIFEQADAMTTIIGFSNAQTDIQDLTINGNKFTCLAAANTNYAFAIQIDKVKMLNIINNEFVSLMGRAICYGSPSPDTACINISNNAFIDCGRTTNSEVSYKFAVVIYGTAKIHTLRIVNNLFQNTGTTITQRAIALEWAPDLGYGEIVNNTIINIPSDGINWNTSSNIGTLIIDHKGTGNPNGVVCASLGSKWLDKSTGTWYTKTSGGNGNTGWN